MMKETIFPEEEDGWQRACAVGYANLLALWAGADFYESLRLAAFSFSYAEFACWLEDIGKET